jgi:hypothetical protein
MALPIATNDITDAVDLTGSAAHITLTESDPDVLAALRRADDAALEAHHLLRLGARVAPAAASAVDTHQLERAVAGMTASFEQAVASAVERLASTTGALLDEGGTLPAAMAGVEASLGALLSTTFDPGSRTSAIARIEQAASAAMASHARSVRELFSLDTEASPIRALRADLADAIRTSAGSLEQQVRELAERLAIQRAEAAARNLTALKGFDYEDAVHAEVALQAAPYGDIAEQVGTLTGSAGTKAGDEVVTLNPDDTGGKPAAYVLEIKDTKLGSRAVRTALCDAIANREALAGIAVFSRQDHAPVHVPFSYSGNQAIAVLDKDELDARALGLAVLWARWCCRCQLGDGGAADPQRVAALLAAARDALGRAATVRRAHSAAQKKIGEAASHLDAMVTDIDEILAEVAAELTA